MTTEEFRRRAADCLRWAQEAANERTKGLWLNMAQIWLDRAEDLKRIQEMVRSDNQTDGQRNLYGISVSNAQSSTSRFLELSGSLAANSFAATELNESK
jgi:hypothetical protein